MSVDQQAKLCGSYEMFKVLEDGYYLAHPRALTAFKGRPARTRQTISRLNYRLSVGFGYLRWLTTAEGQLTKKCYSD